MKLYSLLRLAYAESNAYDPDKGIDVKVQCPISIVQLCKLIGIDSSTVAIATVDGHAVKNYDEILLTDLSEVKLHPQPPAGG